MYNRYSAVSSNEVSPFTRSLSQPAVSIDRLLEELDRFFVEEDNITVDIVRSMLYQTSDMLMQEGMTYPEGRALLARSLLQLQGVTPQTRTRRQ